MFREDLFIVNVSSMNLDEFKILHKPPFFNSWMIKRAGRLALYHSSSIATDNSVRHRLGISRDMNKAEVVEKLLKWSKDFETQAEATFKSFAGCPEWEEIQNSRGH